MSSSLIDEIKKWLLPQIPLLRTPKTVQILLIRQTHDYTIFRTEETREINVAVTPRSTSDPKQTTRAVFMASKQKAPETRNFASLVKQYFSQYQNSPKFRDKYVKLLDEFIEKSKKKEQDKTNLESQLTNAILNCEIKDSLCRTCPRCTLFGAVVTEKSKIWERWNIKHRIEYSSAFSLEPYEQITENITFNAVTESTQLTEQALGTTENIDPLVNFPSVVTLNSPTWEELVLVLKNLLSCKSYGAENRTKGDTVNYITGFAFANEEVLTSLEYVLELSGKDLSCVLNTTFEAEEKYGKEAAFPDALRIFKPQEVEQFVHYVRDLQINEEFVAKAFSDSLRFAIDVNQQASKEG